MDVVLCRNVTLEVLRTTESHAIVGSTSWNTTPLSEGKFDGDIVLIMRNGRRMSSTPYFKRHSDGNYIYAGYENRVKILNCRGEQIVGFQ